jgi:hypothetical protein
MLRTRILSIYNIVTGMSDYRRDLDWQLALLNTSLFPWALQPTFGPWPASMRLSVSLQFTRSWTFGRTPWTGDQLVARSLRAHKHRKTHIQKH